MISETFEFDGVAYVVTPRNGLMSMFAPFINEAVLSGLGETYETVADKPVMWAKVFKFTSFILQVTPAEDVAWWVEAESSRSQLGTAYKAFWDMLAVSPSFADALTGTLDRVDKITVPK